MQRLDPTPTLNNIPLRLGDFTTLADALDYAAAGVTGYNFYSRKGEISATLPYRELRHEARSLARKFMHLGVPRGSCVAVVANTDPAFVRFFFACQYAGLIPVPLPVIMQFNGAEAYTGKLARLLRICKARLAMSTDNYLPFLAKAAEGLDLYFIGSPKDYDALPESRASLHPLRLHELAYLQFTSGSTRFPRGVMISQEAVLSNLQGITSTGVQVRPGDRAVSWLPFYHDMGLVGLLLATMVSQLSVDFFSTIDFVKRPRLWLKLISENKATISFGPPFAYELAAMHFKDNGLARYDLSMWRVAGVGAEMIRGDLLKCFAKCFESCGFDPCSFVPCYGMAECSLAVTFAKLGEGLKVDRVDAGHLANNQEVIHVPPEKDWEMGRTNAFVSCGVPLSGFEVEIRDPEGTVVPEGRCGTLFLRGPSLMSGYLGDTEATIEVLSRDGWLNTGDIAYRLGPEVVITGRSKDLIIINGRNIWAQDIEYLAETLDEVRIGNTCAFSCPDKEGHEQAVLVVQSHIRDSQEQERFTGHLRQMICQELGIDCRVDLVPRNTLVHTSSGKACRQGTRKVYLQKIGLYDSYCCHNRSHRLYRESRAETPDIC